jgi:hypothetical protein
MRFRPPSCTTRDRKRMRRAIRQRHGKSRGAFLRDIKRIIADNIAGMAWERALEHLA